MSDEFISVVQDNPGLPIFAYVDAEICGDGWGYWLGKFNRASVREYAITPMSYPYYGNESDWVFRDEPEDFIQYYVESEACEGLSDEEAYKKVDEYLNSLEWKKGIFCYVDSL